MSLQSLETLRFPAPHREESRETSTQACFSGPLCLNFPICEHQEALKEQKEPGIGVRGPSSATSLDHPIQEQDQNYIESKMN